MTTTHASSSFIVIVLHLSILLIWPFLSFLKINKREREWWVSWISGEIFETSLARISLCRVRTIAADGAELGKHQHCEWSFSKLLAFPSFICTCYCNVWNTNNMSSFCSGKNIWNINFEFWTFLISFGILEHWNSAHIHVYCVMLHARFWCHKWN